MLPVCMVLLPSCASMMNAGKQSLTINSSPQGALVYENGAEVGTTPYTYTYDKPEGGAVTWNCARRAWRTRRSRSLQAKRTASC
ncbi:MAG: PEGA domain-containing protein [Flavobacteriales bacterium]|nr:PEGA domain-containing protein [Flavobacteriales bacterium]